MTHDREHLDPTEAALLDLCAAERAGVFRATDVPSLAGLRLSTAKATKPEHRLNRRALAIAAVLLLAVTAWSTMFYFKLDELRGLRSAFVAAGDPAQPSPMTFAACMGGPSVTKIPDSCRRHDHNGDGRVDLRDASALQLASAHPVP